MYYTHYLHVFRLSLMSDSLWHHGLQSTGLLCPWDSPGKNTEVGCHVLLQGIFPTQGSNPGLLHFRWIRYHLSHKGSPWILEWVVYPFSRGSSWLRNQTRSHTCRQILYKLSYQGIPHTQFNTYVCKSFPTTLEKENKKNRRDRETGKHKLNEMGALNMK